MFPILLSPDNEVTDPPSLAALRGLARSPLRGLARSPSSDSRCAVEEDDDEEDDDEEDDDEEDDDEEDDDEEDDFFDRPISSS